jgi:hypothetical protein
MKTSQQLRKHRPTEFFAQRIRELEFDSREKRDV